MTPLTTIDAFAGCPPECRKSMAMHGRAWLPPPMFAHKLKPCRQSASATVLKKETDD